jgi:8-oxo-dGTP pyrophosphatase MutT (NUDIX family)
MDAAKRELLEETGHVSENWTALGHCTPNPAIQNNRCHFFLALDCRQAVDLALDPMEELRVWGMPYQEWEHKLKSGEVHHGLVLAAFERLRLSPAWGPLQRLLADAPP